MIIVAGQQATAAHAEIVVLVIIFYNGHLV